MPNNTSSSEFILVEQAMGNPPGWLIYWGITVVAFFFSTVLGISAMISYPDILKAEATTYIDHPPIDLFAKTKGTIHTILVQNNDTVQYNTPVLVLESTANWKAVLQLDTRLQQETKTTINTNLSSNDLGELSTLYYELVLLYKQIKDATQNDITSKRILTTHEEVVQNKTLNTSLLKQKKVFEKELSNIKNNLDRSEKLLQDGIISQQEFEQKENTYLQSKRELHRIESAIISNKIKIQQLKIQIPESKKQQHDFFFNLETAFEQKKEALKTAVTKWKEQYILCATSEGIVSMNKNLQKGNQVITTEPLLTILPFIEQKKSFLKAKMDANGLGKIKLGQKATVYFNNYPSTEYGVLTAQVLEISSIPTENQYEVVLALPEEWLTNYGISIPKQQKMKVNIAVQTKEYTLLSRIFSGLLDVIKN